MSIKEEQIKRSYDPDQSKYMVCTDCGYRLPRKQLGKHYTGTHHVTHKIINQRAVDGFAPLNPLMALDVIGSKEQLLIDLDGYYCTVGEFFGRVEYVPIGWMRVEEMQERYHRYEDDQFFGTVTKYLHGAGRIIRTVRIIQQSKQPWWQVWPHTELVKALLPVGWIKDTTERGNPFKMKAIWG